ncbi:MAG TPA: response regulator [Sphingomonas sp.]|nr:response regulator [Sphingomonas sp.]
MPPKHRILIVEDESIIALNLADAVEDAEAELVGPVGSVAEALALLATTPINGAVLDANLFDGVVTPLALHLLDLGVPFVIHTGTGMPVDLAARPLDAPLMMKPATATSVVAKLMEKLDPPHD